MPRHFSDYSVHDWLRLRPLTQSYKTLRYNIMNGLHMRRVARVGDPAGIARTLAGRKVLITVAFEDPQAIEWQIRLVRRYIRCDLHLIADNTPDDGVAAAVQQAAEAAGAPYLRLPASRARSSRSHGLALNWLWHNVVRPGAPEAFGFLDGDLFPTVADDPFAQLATQDFYGVVRPAGERWFLWSGYCLFRFAAVKDQPLDFRQDWFLGLDTGGGNWEVLYRHVDRARMQQAPLRDAPYRNDVPRSESYFQWSKGWLHEVGSTGHPDLEADKRRVVAELLKVHLDDRPSSPGAPSAAG
jgi:hypothetical protein